MSPQTDIAPDDCVTNSLFEEPYWLDCVAPGAWDKIQIDRGGRTIARLPFVLKRRYGLKAISQPWHTPWIGPWIARSSTKAATQTGHEHDALTELLRQLPKAHRELISCAPEFSNLMALHWAGFELQLSYTYRLTALHDHDQLWRNLRDTTRNRCRKAEKVTVVNTQRRLADVMPVLDRTYKRQGMDLSDSYSVLERIDDTMAARKQRTIYSAEDAQGRIHAFVYIVYDRRHSFYIAGGGDPDLRESGAHAWAMWHAVKAAGAHSEIFDFEGSMIPGIEHFMRGFGATLTPRYSAVRSPASLQFADLLLRLARAPLLKGFRHSPKTA